MTYKNDGILRESDLSLPCEEILKKGKTVIIECVENIPCDPCETSCPKKAISVGANICNLPQIEYEKCSGCGLCVAICPGLAIFMLDYSISDTEADLTIPYEIFPYPEQGKEVILVDREGDDVGMGKVIKVSEFKIMNRRKIITVRIPRENASKVRHIRVV